MCPVRSSYNKYTNKRLMMDQCKQILYQHQNDGTNTTSLKRQTKWINEWMDLSRVFKSKVKKQTGRSKSHKPLSISSLFSINIISLMMMVMSYSYSFSIGQHEYVKMFFLRNFFFSDLNRFYVELDIISKK